MHFGFICPPFLGHLNPMQALAAGLRRRGHATSLFGIADVETQIDTRHLAFVPLGGESHPTGSLALLKAHMASPRGLGLARILRDMSRMTDLLCREGPVALRSHGIDALVVDQLEPAGALLAAHVGLPFVSVANALPIEREPEIPPAFTSWDYEATPWGVERNRGGHRVADAIMWPFGRALVRWCRTWNLPQRRRLDEWLSPFGRISQIVPSFDFPRRDPASLGYCGPFRTAQEDGEPIDAGAPFVFASLGTLQGGRYDLFERIALACQQCGVRLVVAHGGALTPAQAAALPGAPMVRAFVPQRQVLARASLAVTNGGLNTVLDALAAAVPVITVPIAFEQGAIGARLAACGAGVSVPLRRSSVAAFGGAIAHGLADSGFRSAARRIATEIAAAGGAERGAELIEAACRRAAPSAEPDRDPAPRAAP